MREKLEHGHFKDSSLFCSYFFNILMIYYINECAGNIYFVSQTPMEYN